MDDYQKQFLLWEITASVLIIGCVIGGAIIGHYLATVLETAP